MSKTILILIADPKSAALPLRTEADSIKRELTHPPRNEQFTLKQQCATMVGEIHRALLEHQPQFVHFSGHCMGERDIILEDEKGKAEPISIDAIADLFKMLTDQVQCVILNACHTTLQASAIACHIDHVIDMSLPLNDNLTIEFVVSFYDALAAGKSIESAFKKGCAAIEIDKIPSHYKPILKKRLKVDKRFENVPLPPNPFFAGREAVLQQLHEALHLHQSVALSSLGGMGKTQTAAHYAYLHRHEYQAILWTLADTKESFNSGLVAMAQVLGLSQGERGNFSQQQSVIAVKHWLETHNDWLLIFDNADDTTIISAFLKGELEGKQENLGKNRHILLTTHTTMVEPLVSSVITMKEMSIEEGVKFFLHSTLENSFDKPDDVLSMERQIAEEIVQELGSLPLALEQASAYIRETQCGLANYLTRYRMHASRWLAKYSTLATTHNYPVSVAMTWTLSFEEIAYESPDAADLLRLCAFLHPDKIPVEIFQVFDIEPVELDKLLTIIYKYSLLYYNPNTKILAIHPLVQTVLKDEMDEEEQRIWAEMVVQAVGSAVSTPGCEDCSDYERLLPCVQTCAVLVEKWKLTFGEQAPEKVSGTEYSERIQTLNNLASLYYIQGTYEQAQSLYEQALALQEKFLGKQHPLVAVSLDNLAGVYQIQGSYEQAKPMYERALAIRKNVYGNEHQEVAQSFNYLAGLYQAQEAYEQAKPLYEQALQILNKLFEPDHQYVYWCQENYTRLLEKMKTTTKT